MAADYKLYACKLCGSSAEFIEDYWGEGIFSAVSCSGCPIVTIGKSDRGFWRQDDVPDCVTEWQEIMNPENEANHG